MWTGEPTVEQASARNAVFYGDKAIDRSPCGTGTSARMAQLVSKGRLALGERFIHESIIGTLFTGVATQATRVGGHDAIVPSIEGWARVTGHNTIFVDDRDPLAKGFLLK
jgi:4-hydroxyproline epimerase